MFILHDAFMLIINFTKEVNKDWEVMFWIDLDKGWFWVWVIVSIS